jgi:hypothetical protein
MHAFMYVLERIDVNTVVRALHAHMSNNTVLHMLEIFKVCLLNETLPPGMSGKQCSYVNNIDGEFISYFGTNRKLIFVE